VKVWWSGKRCWVRFIVAISDFDEGIDLVRADETGRAIRDRLGVSGTESRNEEFVEKYGPEGGMGAFLPGFAGYIRTELVRDVAIDFRYLRWITGSRKKI